jgi:protein-S-isoprenylcysteine O-methyltransferase Ste14
MKTIRIFLLIIGNALALLLALLALETTPTNFLGWFLLAIAVTYGAGGVIHLWRNREAGESARVEKDNRSFWAIMPGFIAVFFIPPLEFLFLPILPHTLGLEIAGLVVILLGLVLRVWTRSASGRMYSGYIRIQAGHVLVTSGPYRFIRHPGYAGFLLMALGICLGYCSLIGLVAIPLLLLPGLAYRMRVEEKLLDGHFGEEYHAYARRTKKLIPGVW